MRYIKNLCLIILFSGVVFSLFPEMLHAQNDPFDAQFYAQKSQDLQKKGMILLGSWATLNILSGAGGYFLSENETKYLHQMNAGWNLVNLGISGFALYGISQMDASVLSYSESLEKLQNFDKILLFNAGLDVGYMAAGAWMWERGIRNDSQRLEGYGKSLILQGGFLLVFDLVLYSLHSPLTNDLIQLSDQFELTASGFRIHF
jgi:hypothetical protein